MKEGGKHGNVWMMNSQEDAKKLQPEDEIPAVADNVHDEKIVVNHEDGNIQDEMLNTDVTIIENLAIINVDLVLEVVNEVDKSNDNLIDVEVV